MFPRDTTRRDGFRQKRQRSSVVLPRTPSEAPEVPERLASLLFANQDNTGKPRQLTFSGADSMPCFAAATLSRLLFLTMYMASSARCSSSAFVFESVG